MDPIKHTYFYTLLVVWESDKFESLPKPRHDKDVYNSNYCTRCAILIVRVRGNALTQNSLTWIVEISKQSS